MLMESQNLFARRLGAVRLAYGAVTGRSNLSRSLFASELGLEKNTYTKYERGESEPPLAVLAGVRRLTGISLDYLIADLDQGIANPAELTSECTATFAERVRWVRELYADDITEVAEKMGVSESTYKRWEDGREPMPDAKQQEFALRFNVSMEYLQRGLPVGIPFAALTLLREAHPTLWRTRPADTRTEQDVDTISPAGAARRRPRRPEVEPESN
jgi:transcriptional regulator with XRE-family HTH domain